MKRIATIASNLLGAVAFDAVAAMLIVLTFRIVGHATYRGGTAAWLPIATLVAVSYVCGGIASWLAGRAGMFASMQLRESVLALALRVDPDISRRIGAGNAQSIALDAELVGTLLVTAAPGAALGLAQSAVGIAVLQRGAAAGWVDIVVGLAIIVLVATGNGLARARDRWSRERGGITDSLIQRLLGLRTVSVQEDPARAAQIGCAQHHRYRIVARRLDLWTLSLTASAFAFSGGLLIIAATKSEAGQSRAIAVGATLLMGVGLTKLTVGIADLVNARNAYRRISRLRSWEHESVPAPPPASRALVEASGLGYRYDSGDGLTEPVSLVLHAGDHVVVTGPSGGGKSTLGELLTQRRAPTSGELRIRTDVRVIRVPQAGDDHLFHASLLFNVLCGHRWPPTNELAREAHELLVELGLGDLLQRMPNGLAQPVGEGGWRLSSGEMARVSLARALVGRPDVVILDETTAPLDPVTRKRTLAVAERHSSAVVVIAHP